MPNTLFSLDARFPQFTGREGESQKLEMVMDYLFQMQEQLRYILANLGSDNFNKTELEIIGNTIREPIKLTVSNRKNESTIELMAGETVLSSDTIRFEGIVTFRDKGDGISRIEGGNIYSELIYSDMLMIMPTDATGGNGVSIQGDGLSFWSGNYKVQLEQAALLRDDSGGLTMRTYEAGDISILSVGNLKLRAEGDIEIIGNLYINGQLYGAG